MKFVQFIQFYSMLSACNKSKTTLAMLVENGIITWMNIKIVAI